MSTINGTIVNNSGARATAIPIVLEYQSNPAVASNVGIYFPVKTIFTDEVGVFSTVLPMGTYKMTVGGIAVYTIVVPDDSNTYDFISRLDPEVAVTQSVANPLAVLGLHIVQNAASLAAVSSVTANRLALLYLPSDVIYTFYRWSASSTATHTGTTVIRPNDTDAGDPGRWLWVDLGLGAAAGGTFFDLLDDMTALKAVASSAANKMRAVKSGPHPLWYYVHGGVEGDTDGTNSVHADDGGGNWIALPLLGT